MHIKWKQNQYLLTSHSQLIPNYNIIEKVLLLETTTETPLKSQMN